MVDWMRILKIGKPGLLISKVNTPKHVGVTTEGIKEWAEQNNTNLEEASNKKFSAIENMVKLQVKYDIPIMTINLEETKDMNNEEVLIKNINRFFSKIATSDLIHKSQIKISILGKWYDLPGNVIEPIKRAIDETKDYDKHFLNFCINYEGHEELIDSCKIIVRQIENRKIKIDEINQQTIKDNLYSSYFLPLDLMIRSGSKHKLTNFLLWDSTDSVVYFTNKNWPDFNKDDFLNALAKFQRN